MCKLRCYLSMIWQQHLQGFNALFFVLHKYFCVSKDLKWWHWTGRKKHIYVDDIKVSFAAQAWPCLSSSRRKIMIWMHQHPHTFVGGTCLRFPNSEAHLAWHALPIFLEMKHSFWIHKNTWTWTCSVLTYNMEWPEVTINSNATSCKSTFLLDPNVESQLLLSCKTSALVCSGPVDQQGGRINNTYQSFMVTLQSLCQSIMFTKLHGHMHTCKVPPCHKPRGLTYVCTVNTLSCTILPTTHAANRS